ncbi:chemotaxis protein CheW [Capilliphycus salinus ALCB114379]|uniref:chemotaxis protein CheW n=1 Tax=Capilliphycus salinus TaxID=2768948 RepID=UPI0039A41E45
MAEISTFLETENFLSFSIAPNFKAMLPTKQLVEIINIAPHEIVPIPQMSEAVVGVFPWQGEVLWALDLSYWMGFDPLLTSKLKSSSCSILKVKIQGKNIGFLIEQVGQIISCEPQKIQSYPVDLPQSVANNPARTSCIKGSWINSQGERLFVFDAASFPGL